MKEVKGWMCPKCGNVYAPWYMECEKCNNAKPQPPKQKVYLDPTTQCVDCEHGEVKQENLPGAAPYVWCPVFNSTRTISDTCLCDTVDLTQMTAGGDK